MRRPSQSLPLLCAFTLVPLLVGLSPAFGADAWHVPEAEVRFELRVTSEPSEPCAGVLAILPDGGVLPRPKPRAVVVDEAGARLKSGCVWFNPDEGLGLVFEAPKSGRTVWVYLTGASTLEPLPQGAAFCPSLLLYTQTGASSLADAERLSRETPPGPKARMGAVEIIGHMENPFGTDQLYDSYYTGWLMIKDAGQHYIATISNDGSEALIDGRLVVSWPGLHTRDGGAKGQHGNAITLSAGLHRVEYFHFKQSAAGYPEADLCWRTPQASPDALPQTIPASAYVHSGSATIKKVQSRTGAPQAVFTAECLSYLWLKDRPMNLWQFRALPTEGVTNQTIYAWQLEGLTVPGQEFYWLFKESEPREVSLTASAGRLKTTAARQICPGTFPKAASLSSASQRQEYRAALLARCRAVAPPARPCVNWDPDLWTTLVQVVEPYESWDVLPEIFERSRTEVLALKTEDRWYLEDVYYELLRYHDKAHVPQWLDRFEKEETDRSRKVGWSLARIDFCLQDLNDPKRARALALDLQGQPLASGLADSARVLIRLGDIELYTGNFARATQYYTDAQDRARDARKAGTALSVEEVRAGRLRSTGAEVEDWRKQTVRAGSYYEEVRNLVKQSYFYQARKILQAWELEFPLSKLNGDYPLAEAEYYSALEDWPRALRIVQTYRKSVQISSFLPAAMQLELDCLEKLKRYDELKALAKDIVKRFPTIPLAEEAKWWINRETPGAETAPRPGKQTELAPPPRPGVKESDAEKRLREFQR